LARFGLTIWKKDLCADKKEKRCPQRSISKIYSTYLNNGSWRF